MISLSQCDLSMRNNVGQFQKLIKLESDAILLIANIKLLLSHLQYLFKADAKAEKTSRLVQILSCVPQFRAFL